MNRRSPLLGTCALVVGALLISGCATHGGTPNEKQRAESAKLLSPLPAPARLALEREVSDGYVTAISPDEFESREVYSTRYMTSDGKKGYIQVTGDGRVLSKRVETDTLSLAEVPENVRNGILAQTGGVKPTKIVRERHGRAQDQYRVEVKLADVPHHMSFDSTGALLSEAAQMSMDDLPAAVTATLMTRFSKLEKKGTKAWEVREKSMVSYIVEGWADGRKNTIALSPDGSVRSVGYEK